MSDLGLLDRDNALICGVAVKTIRRWRRLYQRQGLARSPAPDRLRCPRCDGRELDERAYALLLGVSLGDGHIVRTQRGSYLLALFQDARYPRSVEEWTRTVREVKGGGVHHRRTVGAVRVESQWQHWPCLFPQHGAGRKHLRPIALEQWQREIVQREPEVFLRGLFHSDGCRITNWTERTVGGQRKRVDAALLPRILMHPAPSLSGQVHQDPRRNPVRRSRMPVPLPRRRRRDGGRAGRWWSRGCRAGSRPR